MIADLLRRSLVALSVAAALIFSGATASAQFADQANFASTGSVTGGNPNAQTLTLNNVLSFADILGVPIRYIPSTPNTGSATLSVIGQNTLTPTTIQKKTSAGLVNLVGGELQAQIATVTYDGSVFELETINAAPPVTTYITSSGTYSTPTGATSLEITEIAGGGGGGGNGTGTSAGGGTQGGSTSIGGVSVAGGGPGGQNGGTTGGLAGSPLSGTGSGTYLERFPAGAGQPGLNQESGTGVVDLASSLGGGSCLASSNSTSPGAGGNGAGSGTVTIGTSGGGAGGECATFTIISPSSSYSVTVGAGGAGGLAGTSGGSGRAGVLGLVIVKAFFN
jgi:hypothetical protein